MLRAKKKIKAFGDRTSCWPGKLSERDTATTRASKVYRDRDLRRGIALPTEETERGRVRGNVVNLHVREV